MKLNRLNNLFPWIGISAVILPLFMVEAVNKQNDFSAFSRGMESTFIKRATIEPTGRDSQSNGDLWPSAWSEDGWLYAANGDGNGFGQVFGDIVINRISGHPDSANVHGEVIWVGVGKIWGDTAHYNRKPTGLLASNGSLYLAVQDLNKQGPDIFNEAPAATILRSDDAGKTWQYDAIRPMFDQGIFTTIMFLDYGRNGRNNPDKKHIYIYGLDHNWRDSFSNVVPDPTQLFLARVPVGKIQNIDHWQFYTGESGGHVTWSAPGEIEKKRPVLTDSRRRYKNTRFMPSGFSVLSQGGVVYNKPMKRYIYSSWTEFTFEFYEAPAPWGPWKLFLSQDFGHYPWKDDEYGGYATVIPSKYISADGKEMWVSSSTFAGGVDHYNFSLRKLTVETAE